MMTTQRKERLWYSGKWWEKEYSTAEADVYISADGRKRLYVFWDGTKLIISCKLVKERR